MSTLPKRYYTPVNATLKRPKLGRHRPAANYWVRTRLDYNALEAAKVWRESILYAEYARPGHESHHRRWLRVSILPWSRSGYLDIRFYREHPAQKCKGLRPRCDHVDPTGAGALIHLDKFDALLGALQAARLEIERLRALGLVGN